MTMTDLRDFNPSTPDATELPENRPTRRSLRVEEMDRALVEALAAANVSHLDPKLNKLME